MADNASVTTFTSVNSNESWVPEDDHVLIKSSTAPLPVPYGTRDVITDKLIYTGTRMAEFSGERKRGRFYTRKTYMSLNTPKRNPFNRKPISEVLYYTAAITPRDVSKKGGRSKTLRGVRGGRRRGMVVRRSSMRKTQRR